MCSVRFGASRFFSSKPVLVAAAGLLPMVLAAGQAIAATPPAPQGTTAAAELSPVQLLERARQQLNTGKPVLARALATRAVSMGADAASAAEIVARARLAIEELSPAELSLQKAELAIEEGDLRTADRHLQAVSASPGVAGFSAARIEALRSQWETRRSELAPIIADTLAQAERDFLAKRYAEARAGFQLVDRSGVALTPSQQSTLDRYQLALVQLAEREPAVFGKIGNAGMMQPGVVRRREGGSAPAAQPEAQPPAEPVQPAAQPEPVPAPVAEPMPVPLPVAQPAGDPIAQARVQEATDLLALADRAFVEKRFADALTRYERIRIEFTDVLSAEQRALVERRISESRVMINADRLGTPEAELANRDLARQQIQAEFENDLELARRALAGGNTADARNRVAQARLRLSSGRNLFAEATLEQLQDRATALAAEIDREEQRLAQVRAEERDRAVREQATRAQQSAREERERKIAELVLRAREFQREKRYREALQTAEQILFLDPINPTGLLLKDIYQDVLIFEDSRSIYERKQYNRATLSMENQRAAIPPLNLVDFPPDWPAISARRGEPVQFAEPAENRRVLGLLEQTRVPTVTLADNSLEDAIRFFTTISQLNVDVDWASLEEAGIRRDTTLSLNLTNVSQKQLLDRIVEKVSGFDAASRAGWAVIDGVVTIASDRRIRRNTVLVIYDIKDLLTEIPDFRDAPRIDLQQALQASQGGGGGGSGPFTDTGGNEQEQDEQRRQQRDERMTELENIIIDNVDSEGWVPRGGETGTITRLANQGSFIIRNTPANHREITGLLRKLREVRAMQINVECRFLLVNQDFFEQIGIDLDVYINANNNQVRAARGFDQSIRGSDFFNFDGPGLVRDVQGSTRRVPAQAVAPTPANPAGATGAGAVTQGVVPPRNWSPIGFGQNSLGLSQAVVPRSANWGDLILSNAPALGIAGQFLDDIQVDFLIKATQADRRSAQLTAPRVTFTNGQASNIYVATQTAFVSDLQPVTSDSAVGFDPTVGVVTEGVTLLVEGTISADRRFVTMTVDGGVARVNGFANQAVSAVAGGQLVNSASVQSFIQLPQITVTRVRTTVTVPDQGTLLLGGQRLVTEYEVESGVPVLSKLPILNRFFTNRIESKEEQTLLVLIKPTIMIMGEDEERNFPGLSQSLGLGGN